MSISSSVKNTIEKNIINSLGSITIFRTLSETFNNYDDVTYEVTGTGTIKSIPSRYFPKRPDMQVFGNIQQGDLRLLFLSGTTLDGLRGTANNYEVVYKGGTYKPSDDGEQNIVLQETNIATIIGFERVKVLG